MKIALPVLVLIAAFFSSAAQEKLRVITLEDTLMEIAIDRPGDFYTIAQSGRIKKFDKDGKVIATYKAEQSPTLFDPRDGARLFIYYRDTQRYDFLNPSFEPLGSYEADPSFAIDPWLISPSGEYKLWILDKADNSLKKVNIKSASIEAEIVIDSSAIGSAEQFTTMREYQNFVFLFAPSKGIFVFNSLGRHIRTLDLPDIDNFNFLGEELYYLRGDSLEFFNLFSTGIRKIQVAPGYTRALLTDERMIMANPNRIDIYSFRP